MTRHLKRTRVPSVNALPLASMSGSSQPPPRMATEKLSQAAIGAASSALVAHSGGGMPPVGGGRSGAAQEVDLEDLFSLKKPKNVLSGATSGLQSVAKGGRRNTQARTPACCCAQPLAEAPVCRHRGRGTSQDQATRAGTQWLASRLLWGPSLPWPRVGCSPAGVGLVPPPRVT